MKANLIFALSFASLAVSASAATIPVSGFSGAVSVSGNQLPDPIQGLSQNITDTGPITLSSTSSTRGLVNGQFSTSTGSATVSYAGQTTPFPALDMTASSVAAGTVGLGGVSGGGSATLDYYFMVTGPSGLTALAVSAFGYADANFTAPTSSGNYANALVSLTFSTPSVHQQSGDTLFGFYQQAKVNLQSSGSGRQDLNLNSIFQVSTNTPYLVRMVAQVGAGSNIGGIPASVSSNAHAYIDPTFALVGTNAANYSLSFSPGIGNTPVGNVPDGGSLLGVLAAAVGALTLLRRISGLPGLT